MDIQLNEIEKCRYSVKYIADAGEILDKRSTVLQAFKKAPVPGFRPGKGSLDAIKLHYRSQIEDALKRALAEDAYHNTIFEKKLRPHGAPKFNSMIMLDGRFVCEFDINCKPDFTLAPYKNLEIPKPHDKYTQAVYAEKLMQELRMKYGDVTPYNETDTVEMGDNVIIDYDGFLNGEKVDNFSAAGEMITVGNSQLENFDANLVGMKLGDVKEFIMKVPDNGLPSLVGKDILFKITLNMGSKTVPCALDDEFAKKLGKSSFDELKTFIAGMSAARVQETNRQSLVDAISAKLVADNTFEVPAWLSLSEARYLTHNAKVDFDTLDELDKAQYVSVAENNVKLSLILDKIREEEIEAQLSDQEVFDIIKQNLAKSKVDTSIDEVISKMNSTGYLQILMSRIKDQYVLDMCARTAKIID